MFVEGRKNRPRYHSIGPCRTSRLYVNVFTVSHTMDDLVV